MAPLDRTGGQIPELDEVELRSGRLAAAERVGQRKGSRNTESSTRAAGIPDSEWTRRLQSVMHEALGARYSTNGTSPKTGLSPGGLVHWVFRRLGVRAVPQLVEDQQEMAGARVEALDYRPQVGDLLFFSIGKMRHVGIYFDPDQNTFLTVVPSKGGVVIADFDHPFFRARFLFARRIAAPTP